MTLQELLVDELEHEAKLTKTFLERIPESQLDWQPHAKSMTMKQLGSHLAEIPAWVTATMNASELQMDNYQPPQVNSVAEMISTLESNTAAAKAALAKEDDEYNQPWAMKNGDQELMKMPKYQVLRKMVMPQLPHHRAQLGVYLRMLNQNVPASYGPSADES